MRGGLICTFFSLLVMLALQPCLNLRLSHQASKQERNPTIQQIVLARRKHAIKSGLRKSMAELMWSDASLMDPIASFSRSMQKMSFQASGMYWEFRSASNERVFSGQIEGRIGAWVNAKTPLLLASASKLFIGLAAMCTFERKPDFHPDREIHTFQGWETWKNFKVAGQDTTADLTIHHLLTHTSGIPFAMRASKNDISRMTLMYTPGTKFGYTIGHRVAGWVLRDYWQLQPEAKDANIQTVQDCLEFLFKKIGFSSETKFSSAMWSLFGLSGEAGDAALQSTGKDFMKLAVVALGKGTLPDGTVLISRENWDKWAVPNLLPEGKLSEDLVDWQRTPFNSSNWNVGGLKEDVMRQSGSYGWNYFGATFYESTQIGWCGFFSSCLRVSYTQDVAFVMMQRNVDDFKGSKKYLQQYFESMANSLQCEEKEPACNDTSQNSRWCQICEEDPVTNHRKCMYSAWFTDCPSWCKVGKSEASRSCFNPDFRTCYEPRCGIPSWL